MTTSNEPTPGVVIPRQGYPAAGSDRWPCWKLWARVLLPLLADAVGPAATVLHAGCGTGLLARLFASDKHHVIGVDDCRWQLAVAAQHASAEGVRVRWQHGDAAAPPVGPFDAVVSHDVLWTLPDPLGALRAWRTVLRPGGLLLINDSGGGAMNGLDYLACAELVAAAGFTEITDHSGLFDWMLYPDVQGFFLLTAHTRRQAK